ncbi:MULTISPECIES: hypothetical protein [Caballeronia]|uniref:Uncharacterized protein n=2 Tax=Caballeronia TaxID=1827195 RepID=A0ACB5QPX1_9BURK|nr:MULTISPECIES: hypothetical protein [Caballeronia]GJH12671.1 hypothetical protein CBA19CS11_27555 [Caballeronia novacaledonica]GJH17244.1 hypothetical protein CBA19CS22_11900 [Caballeronia novacaledonica]
MPNVVEFIVPKAKKAALDFTLKPADFRAQFGPAAPPTLPLPSPSLSKPQLLADALDCGYGRNIPPMPSLSAAEQSALQKHLRTQLNLTLTLLKQSQPPLGDWVLRPFAPILEKTAKTTDSFALGMLYARVATRLWGQARGFGSIVEFWHYGVLASNAANFMSGVLWEEENPDFLVKFANGLWACVEAKGALSDKDNAVLKKGLSQACKLAAVKWQHGSAATPSIVYPAEHACSMTYFEPTSNALQVMFMDPPAEAVDAPPEEPKGPRLFKDGGDFLRWAQALEQFEDLASSSDAPVPVELQRLGAHRFDWASFPGEQDMWVGIPRNMRQHSEQLNSALVILEWLVPYLTRWRREPSVTVRGVNRRLLNMARYAASRANAPTPGWSDSEAYLWSRLALFLNGYREGNGEVFQWSDVLRDIWRCDLLPGLDADLDVPADKKGTFNRLWNVFDRTARRERRYWQGRSNLERRDAASAPFAQTSHGLLIVSRRWALVANESPPRGRNRSLNRLDE